MNINYDNTLLICNIITLQLTQPIKLSSRYFKNQGLKAGKHNNTYHQLGETKTRVNWDWVQGCLLCYWKISKYIGIDLESLNFWSKPIYQFASSAFKILFNKLIIRPLGS